MQWRNDGVAALQRLVTGAPAGKGAPDSPECS